MSYKLIFLCIACFFSAFVDSIAGGGGVISIPAFLLAGIPPHMALGTNKFTSCFSTFSSSVKYIQSKKADFSILKHVLPFSFIGAILGVTTVLKIDTKYLNTIVLILLLFVGVYSLFSKDMGKEDRFQGINKKNKILGALLGLILGFYDGFLGAGVGAFYIFGLISIFKVDFLKAGATCRILNFAGNIGAIFIFAIKGQIDLKIGLPVALVMMIGARLGAKAALIKGAKLIKPIFVTMALAVATKLLL